MKKHPFLSLLLAILVVSVWIHFYSNNTDIQSHSEMPSVQTNADPEVAFDWANNRGITKRMADTMMLIDKHWYGIKQIESLQKRRKESAAETEPQWIKPAGREYNIGKNDNTLRLWREQQKIKKQQEEQLTPEDVRQIVQEEMDGNH